MQREAMYRRLRPLGLTVLLVAVALPAWANNPPRPDGVLYLLLVFPVALVARHLAGVEAPERRLSSRIGRAVFFTLVVLLSAAGTELGLVAMLVVVGYGLTRALEILARGEGAKRLVLSSLVAVSTLAAGAGYLWVLGAGSAEMFAQARQKRTVADVRNIGVAATGWLLDQAPPAASATAGTVGVSDGDGEPATAAAAAAVPPEGDKWGVPPEGDKWVMPEEPPAKIAFDGAAAPPRISHAELEQLLVPRYARDLPELDGWQRPYELRLDRERHRFWIRSAGRDGTFDSEPYIKGPFDPKDHDRDVVWADGELWCWPGSP